MVIFIIFINIIIEHLHHDLDRNQIVFMAKTRLHFKTKSTGGVWRTRPMGSQQASHRPGSGPTVVMVVVVVLKHWSTEALDTMSRVRQQVTQAQFHEWIKKKTEGVEESAMRTEVVQGSLQSWSGRGDRWRSIRVGEKVFRIAYSALVCPRGPGGGGGGGASPYEGLQQNQGPGPANTPLWVSQCFELKV